MGRSLKRIIGLVVMIVLGFILFNLTAFRLKDFRVGDLGLGIATTTKIEYIGSLQINQIDGGYEKIIPAVNAFKNEHREVCLLMGNSQLHAINNQTAGDHLAVHYLNQAATEEGFDFRAVQLSSGNINFQEMLLYYITLRKIGIKPSWIIVGCTYRMFQLMSLREKFKEQLRMSARYLNEINLNAEVRQFYKEQAELLRIDQTPDEQGTLQEETEEHITNFLQRNWEAYQYRGNVRSRIKILPGMVYRSTLSDKNFYSGSETTETLNMLFLQQLIQLCKTDGVKVLLYQPPHPPSKVVPFQYDSTRYKDCFARLRALTDRDSNVYFESFESLVPIEFWGTNNSGRLDAFHFRRRGHQILGEQIFNFLKGQAVP